MIFTGRTQQEARINALEHELTSAIQSLQRRVSDIEQRNIRQDCRHCFCQRKFSPMLGARIEMCCLCGHNREADDGQG